MRPTAWLALIPVLLSVVAASCSSGGDATVVATFDPSTTITSTASATGSASPTPSATLFGTFTPTPTPTPSDKQVQIYRNDTYGYSFSVACPAFCQLDDTALDTFRAVSTDGRNAWIEARVTLLSEIEGEPTLESLHAAWKKDLEANAQDFVEVSTKSTTLIDRTTPALSVEWTATSADTAGSDLHATTLLAVSGPLGYSLGVGAPAGADELLKEDLDLVLQTFNVEGQTENVPGRYANYEFLFEYPPSWEGAQAGLNPGTPPDLEQGQFRAGIRPPGPAAVVLVTWNTITKDSFDPAKDIDQAITQAEQASSAYETLVEGKGTADGEEVSYFLYQDALEDGRAIYAGFGEWFCEESSRVFTMFFGSDTTMTQEQLQGRFDEMLASFRCSVPTTEP